MPQFNPGKNLDTGRIEVGHYASIFYFSGGRAGVLLDLNTMTAL